MESKHFTITVFFIILCTHLFAQKNIFDALNTKDSASGTVVIHQDKRIEEIVVKKEVVTVKEAVATSPGFRVQVFSGSNLKTSKTDAYNIESQIKEAFPNQAIYVNYTSPSWKVRVGDFTTQTDAQSFQTELIKAFPSMRSEIYIVKEQILLPTKK
jgi:SPOR domain